MAEFHSCVPHYLLERPGHGARAIGGVLCVPGAVRAHVSSEELEAWTEALLDGSMHLQVLGSDSPEYLPDALEEEWRDIHLDLRRDCLDEREAWLRQRMEAAAATARQKREAEASKQAWFMSQRLSCCLLRCECPRMKKAFKVGDMVTTREKPGSLVGVIAQLGHLEDLHGPPIPTGHCDVLTWDARCAAFGKGANDVPLPLLELFPVCCGQARYGYGLEADAQQKLLDSVRTLQQCKKRPRDSAAHAPPPAAKAVCTSDSEDDSASGSGSDAEQSICSDGPDDD